MIRKEYIEPRTNTVLVEIDNLMGNVNSPGTEIKPTNPDEGDPSTSPAKKYSFWDDDDSETNDED